MFKLSHHSSPNGHARRISSNSQTKVITGDNQLASKQQWLLSSLCLAIASALMLTPTNSHAAFNIPTDAPPSPLFGATEFSTKMLLFEEFGMQTLPATASTSNLLPAPSACDNSPGSAALDAFLGGNSLFPLPTEAALEGKANPWDAKIKQCIPTVFKTKQDARPPGQLFAHQRFNEFKPKVFVQTAQTATRVNGGVRDKFQRHGYKVGEFAPGGLYHNTALDLAQFNGTTKGIGIRIHPKMPLQVGNSVWTFDGTLPPKLLMARYGESILFRHHNALPVNPGANGGFGEHTITTHMHNGHNPAESDGYAHAFSFPGEFYDYNWPMVLAGHDSININASEQKAGTPNGKLITRIRGDYRETQSSLWFHDHMLDFTAQNVYKGNAAAMNIYSALDRGNEAINDGVNLRFPSGSALDWGNRDYDVNLLIGDKAWDSKGQLFFNVFNTDGFLGDRLTVNWQWKPYFEVRARKYRFRILNGSVARYFKIALVDEAGNKVPFHMVANDGNIMEHAVKFPNALTDSLPAIAIGERYDIVIDFKNFTGKKLYFVNLMEHEKGRGPERVVPLADVLSGAYKPDYQNGDPAVGKFLEFRVKPYTGQDLSMNPADYEETTAQGRPGLKMLPLPTFTTAELRAAKHRTFEFGRSGGTDGRPWTVKTDGGKGLTADPHRLSAAPNKESVEIWHLKSNSGGWAHPIHIHFEEGQIIYRGGKTPPPWEKWARKDIYRVGPLPEDGATVDVKIRFREFMGTYVEHCHNTMHEDNAMLLRWDVQNPGNTIAIPTPMPEWESVAYEPSFTLPTYKVGDTKAAANFNFLGGSAPANVPPTVAIKSPLNNASFNKGATVTLTIDAFDKNGSVTKVELFVNGALFGSVNLRAFPYTINVPAGITGKYVLTAKAYDNAGATTTSPAVTINVR